MTRSATNGVESAPPRPRIGAQIKTAGGFSPVPQRAVDIGAEVVQIFNSNARMWRTKPYDPEEIATLRRGLSAHGLPLFFHTIYLINLASPDEELRKKSGTALAEALFIGAAAGAEGVVIHVGSHRGEGFGVALPWVRNALLAAQDQAREHLASLSPTLPLPPVLLESSAGSGYVMGKSLAELEALVEVCPEPCGLCLDTAHLFASGVPVHTQEGLEQLVSDLESRDLLRLLKLIHLNDSRTPFASGRDHHENLGQGQLGYDALGRVIRHPAFSTLPFVLEVPGLDGHGPDAFSIETARAMRRGDPAPPVPPAPSA